MESIHKALTTCFKHFGTKPTYWIGLSGGLDSCVLLDACYQLAKKANVRLQVVHVNHGLSPHAHRWQTKCESLCKAYALPYRTHTILPHSLSNGNKEAECRKLRYQFFAAELATGDVLLTAHHKEDQAETLLLQLCRGAGPKGLAAMPAMKAWANGFHARPFLNISKAQLQSYAKHEKLSWVEDESNLDTQFARNFLRHKVLPVLSEVWPTISDTLHRSASHCAEQETLLGEFAQQEIEACEGSVSNTLSVQQLLKRSAAKQRLLLRVWLMQQGVTLPNTKKLFNLQKMMLEAKPDRFPKATWGEIEVRRFQDDLFVLNKESFFPQKNIEWDFQTPLRLTGIGELSVHNEYAKGITPSLKKVEVRFREGGERIHLGKRGHKTLKNLFQEWRIAPWERERIPLLYDGDRLIEVVGYCLDPAYRAEDEEGQVVALLTREGD